jgi:cobalt-zinc-cadmium efflux system membrane fusion protein
MAPPIEITRARAATVGLLVIIIVIVAFWALRPSEAPKSAPATGAAQATPKNAVDLSDSQLASVKVAPVEERDFPIEKRAVGSIDFNEDMSVQVFAPYQGRIIALFAEVGDDVKKGQTLFTIDSADLLQAESTLIAATGVLELDNKNLARLQDLYTTRAVSQHDLEQATSDQQTAQGNLAAARDAVRIFGKSDADLDKIISTRTADPTLVVPSPIDGRVTARSAAPGLFVQPGSTPAPFTVTDINTMWMLANVTESDSPAFKVGQQLRVSLDAFPGHTYEGVITTVGAIVDPNTRRVLVRSQIKDPQHELRSGMFANFVIDVGSPVRSPAIPADGVVREGDGTMSAWVTADRRRFTQRVVKIGKEHDGYWQILDGVQAGELVATEGALFLSNELAIGSN